MEVNDVDGHLGLVGLEAIGGQTRERVNHEVDRAAVARVLALELVLQLVDHRLHKRPSPQVLLLEFGALDRLHVLAKRRDQLEPVFLNPLPADAPLVLPD